MARKRKNKSKGSQDFDPTRWAHAVFVLAAFMLMWAFSHLVEDVWAAVWSQWPQAVPRPQTLWANAGGIVIGLAGAIYGWRVDKYFKFICEVSIEVSQVVWPTRAEVRAATIVVITMTLICSGLLSIMDFGWSNATDYLYSL
jgi:preprotein translocase subunit SecE